MASYLFISYQLSPQRSNLPHCTDGETEAESGSQLLSAHPEAPTFIYISESPRRRGAIGIDMTARRGPGSWSPSPDMSPTMRTTLSYLQREPLISNDGCFGPVDDFRERQLPAGAEEHRDAASLGGAGQSLGNLAHYPAGHQQPRPREGKDKEESRGGQGPSFLRVGAQHFLLAQGEAGECSDWGVPEGLGESRR